YQANQQLENFAILTRQILSISGKKKISIGLEKEVLTRYLELEKMRFQQDFEYEIILSEAIDEDYDQIPPMLVQPIVENSIKHGLLHKMGPKKVIIRFYFSDDQTNLICEVEDNGIGLEESAKIKQFQPQKHESFATFSIQKRLELLHNNEEGKYMEMIDLSKQNPECTGTLVRIQLPRL
ncbi:MAG: phytochrome sensor protein, partial [Bacteroidia bacterium]|nr:phytochrome sensor protein [Bacteroidia bacterium]